VTDLEERTRQLHVLDNILRHNIRNELNVIHGRGEQLQKNLEGEPKAAAGTIVDRAETLLTTSEKSREITTVLSDSHGPTSVDIGQVVRVLAKETATL
ncbi:sensor histidine kinase, partial [Halorubrum tibetense]